MERKTYTGMDILKADVAELVRMHRFESSRFNDDGSEPEAPNWNPGCSCGEGMYYFEWDEHLASVMLGYLDSGKFIDHSDLTSKSATAHHNEFHAERLAKARLQFAEEEDADI